MNILTRKCDVCGTRHDSDSAEYFRFGQLENPDSSRQEVCAACVGRLHAGVITDVSHAA